MEEESGDFRLKIEGKWLLITEGFQARHPGGSVITQYRFAILQTLLIASFLTNL